MPTTRRKRETQNSETGEKRIKPNGDETTLHITSDRLAISMSTTRPKKVNGTSKDPELDLEWLMRHPKSKLKDKDLSDCINYENWLDFSDLERASLLRLLPDVDKLDNDVDPCFFSHNQFLQSAITDFQDALFNGQYTVEFQRSLATERAKTQTDDWKDEQFEEYWGQKYDAMTRGLAGDSSAVKISDMAKHGLIRIGDVWRLSRPVYNVKVQAEAVITGISSSFELTFSYDPTKAVVTLSDEKESKSARQNGNATATANGKQHAKRTSVHDVSDVTSPTNLETHILKVTPNVPDKWPNGNAFKSIRVLRNGVDEGTLFSMRLEWFNDGCPMLNGGPHTASSHAQNGKATPKSKPKDAVAKEEQDDKDGLLQEFVPASSTTRSSRKSQRK